MLYLANFPCLVPACFSYTVCCIHIIWLKTIPASGGIGFITLTLTDTGTSNNHIKLIIALHYDWTNVQQIPRTTKEFRGVIWPKCHCNQINHSLAFIIGLQEQCAHLKGLCNRHQSWNMFTKDIRCVNAMHLTVNMKNL